MDARLTGINEGQVLSYLGFRGRKEAAEVLEKIPQAWQALVRAAAPKLTYRVFEAGAQEQVEALLEGSDIKALLRESHHVVLFGATLGAGVDALLARLQVADMGQALLVDACADSAIETLCDHFCGDMAEQYGFLTDRFSPGYGDFPLHVQERLAKVLDLQRTIGVTLTDSGLMVPQKSVTAVFGIADKAQPRRVRGCGNCNLHETCALRKEGKACANK